MTQGPPNATVIAFHGVQLALPASLPFSYQNNCLVLDFSLGFTGKLTIQPVSTQLATGSPTFQLARLSQPQSSAPPAIQQPVLEQQHSQPPDFSQGAYPPWMLQSSNPAFCIPDSLGTQSPMCKGKHTAVLPAVQRSSSLQQHEGQTRNAAALQELMTQADPSDPDAEDFDTDAGVNDVVIPSTADEAAVDNAAQEADEQMLDVRASTSTDPETDKTPGPASLPHDQTYVHTDKGRGAGTPAGPHEEFYSPPEHLQPDAMDYAERSTAHPHATAPESGHTIAPPATVVGGNKASLAAALAAAQPTVKAAAPVEPAAHAVEALQSKTQVAAAPQAKTPLQANVQTKTPGNGKHRLSSKSVPPSSKRRKASAGIGALAEASFSWRPLEAEWSKASTLPDERWGGTLTSIEPDKVLLMGGAGKETQLGDAWVMKLGTTDVCWAPLPGACPTPARAWHSAHMLQTDQGRQMVMFGGEHDIQQDENTKPKQGKEADSDEETSTEILNNISLLEADSSMWIDIPISGQGGKGPPARTGHSCTVLPDGKLLIFGGVDDVGKFKNDMFVVDVKRLTWYKMAGVVKGAPPKPRAYHTATLLGNRIIVMGGLGTRAWSLKEVYSLHIETWKWSEHTAEVEGEAPSPRYGHAAVALPDDRHVATFGGGDADDDMFFSSITLLDTLTWRWSTPKVQGLTRPCGRSGHGMTLAMQGDKTVMLVHGGRSKGDVLHNDTWLLELPAMEVAV